MVEKFPEGPTKEPNDQPGELNMKGRMDYKSTAPEGIKAMWGLEQYVHRCGLEPSLLELAKTRASQINGCAYCLDIHTKDARAQGESEQRLYTLSAWK
jgi:AhpD family alkylhydroperoxidase